MARLTEPVEPVWWMTQSALNDTADHLRDLIAEQEAEALRKDRA